MLGGGMTASDGEPQCSWSSARGSHVGGPGPAQMVRECAFEAQRALLELIVVVGRHLGWVAGPDEGVEIVDHEGGAAKDSGRSVRVWAER